MERFRMARDKGCPIRHLIVEDKKEVWFVGSSTVAMGLKGITAKWFPGYTGKLASREYFNELSELYGKD